MLSSPNFHTFSVPNEIDSLYVLQSAQNIIKILECYLYSLNSGQDNDSAILDGHQPTKVTKIN